MPDFRELPQVDRLSGNPILSALTSSRRIATARRAIDRARELIEAGEKFDIEQLLMEELQPTSEMVSVINLSGVILHTGLGRARLAARAVDRIHQVASGHAALELDLESGRRGDRQSFVRSMLVELTGAEDALVVNNAAAALSLSLRAIAEGGDVLLSRGEMVEIGGSFRVPDIVAASGCNLVEVGCTNKTHLRDYEVPAAAVLKCHTSNYRVVGFAGTPSIGDLARHCKGRVVPLVHDQGTGLLVDTEAWGIPRLPTVQASLQAGAEVVVASCDKLLGGPQGGMILGSSKWVQRIAAHPLARTMRVDKLTLAALSATLELYCDGLQGEIPTIAYLSRPLELIRSYADKIADACGGRVEAGFSEIGGGAGAGADLPTWRVGLQSESAAALSRELRTGRPAILARIENNCVWMDPRTVEEHELEEVLRRVSKMTQ